MLELQYKLSKSPSSLSEIFILLLPADATTIQPAAIAFSAAEEVVVEETDVQEEEEVESEEEAEETEQ